MNKHTLSTLILAGLVIGMLTCPSALLFSQTDPSGSSPLTARQIIERADEAFTGSRLYSTSTLTIYRSGKTLPPQTMESYGMEINGDYHSLTVYRAPARMKGTAYLMIEDDLWVRFSSTGRIRKLSSSAKKNSAGGSDFSYADMGEGNQGIADKYEVALTGEDAVAGTRCHVIDLTPKPGEDLPYEKVTAYISTDDLRYLKLDYFEAGANIKSMILEDYRQAGDHYYPYLVEMRSNTRDSRTVVETTLIEFDSSRVQQRLFSTAYLETIR